MHSCHHNWFVGCICAAQGPLLTLCVPVSQHLVDEKPEGCVNEVVQQLAFSDVLLLNKTDLVTAEELQNVRKVIRAVNNTASIIECQLNRPEGRPTLDKLIDTSSFSVSRALQVRCVACCRPERDAHAGADCLWC